MTRRLLANGDTQREEPDPNIENLNIREAMRQARERTNRERNREKCRRYYQKRVGEKESGQ
jgi:hypothetical protein